MKRLCSALLLAGFLLSPLGCDDKKSSGGSSGSAPPAPPAGPKGNQKTPPKALE